MSVPAPEAGRQLPIGDEMFLDHVGHFVRDAKTASAALQRVGFAPAPVSVQVNPDGTPTGTGNVTAMFEGGYIEVLFTTADTPLAREFEASITAFAGVHLAACSIADAAKEHKRLTDAGFSMRPLVQFQRPVDTEQGPDIAAFSVVRLERGAMTEGRIQLLTHRTEHTVWQKRWLKHPNGAIALAELAVVSADVAEATGRFERFTGRKAEPTRFGQAIQLDRGAIRIITAETFTAQLPEIKIPRLPFMGAYAIQVRSVDALEQRLRDAALPARRIGAALAVPFPEPLGAGAWLFAQNAADLPWRV